MLLRRLTGVRRRALSTVSGRQVALRRIAARNKQEFGDTPNSGGGQNASRAIGAAGGAVLALGLGGTLLFTDAGKKALDQLGPVDSWLPESVRQLIHPTKEDLLPDWPVAGPSPRTLVLDLEDTLVHMEWDRRYGWRTAKRPGLDQFLMRLSACYEIVIFTDGPYVAVDNVTYQLDPNNFVTHRLFQDAAVLRDGKYLKDLSRLNRDLSRVIIVDDDPERTQLQSENAINIIPFGDASNTADRKLIELIPFLEDLVQRDVNDVREELRKYEGRDVGEEFARTLMQRRRHAKAERAKGLGGFIRRRKGGAS